MAQGQGSAPALRWVGALLGGGSTGGGSTGWGLYWVEQSHIGLYGDAVKPCRVWMIQ